MAEFPELEKLRDAPGESDGYRFRPSELAFAAAYRFLALPEVARCVTPDFVSDGAGGIDIEWEVLNGYGAYLSCRDDGCVFLTFKEPQFQELEASEENFAKQLKRIRNIAKSQLTTATLAP